AIVDEGAEGEPVERAAARATVGLEGIDDRADVGWLGRDRHESGGGAPVAGDEHDFAALDTVEQLRQVRLGLIGSDVLHGREGKLVCRPVYTFWSRRATRGISHQSRATSAGG